MRGCNSVGWTVTLDVFAMTGCRESILVDVVAEVCPGGTCCENEGISGRLVDKLRDSQVDGWVENGHELLLTNVVSKR